ncbi:MAG: LemA family protein [Patescibacteria group bacterium]
MSPTSWFVIAVFVLAIGWVVLLYNRLIALRNQVQEAWSDIDVQLKRRYDLIPNLVQVVKGYAKHERLVFTEVTKLRNQALNASSPSEKAQADNLISGALKSIFALAENYPTLRSSENFQQLQGELADTENKIAASRRFYNTVTQNYNTSVMSFPTNILAQSLKFKERELFEIDNPEARKTPTLKL